MVDQDARTLNQATQAQLRQQAVAMRAEGNTRSKVARLLGVHVKTVTRWTGDYKKHGEAVFATRKRGRRTGDRRRLTPAQEKATQLILIEKTPLECGFPYELWTRQTLCLLIERECDIRMPIRTCGEYLARWGFIPQISSRMAPPEIPDDSSQAHRWLRETYPAIIAHARNSGAKIHWLRTANIHAGAHNAIPTPSTGEPAATDLTPLGMVYSVTNQGKISWLFCRKPIGIPMFVRFIDGLISETKKKIILITDQDELATVAAQWPANTIQIHHFPSSKVALSLAPESLPAGMTHTGINTLALH
ncbi:MAG: helix-turn-helix domain-containing protein [Verrucomicrobiota bacterium]